MAQSMTPEERRRLGAPSLRTFLAIADLWGLDDFQRRCVLGDAPEVDGWIASALGHRPVDLPLEMLERIGVVLAIHAALGLLHAERQEGVTWLRTPHHAPIFGSRWPLDLIIDGTQIGPIVVLEFLTAAGQSSYMPPGPLDRHWRPLGDDDISIG